MVKQRQQQDSLKMSSNQTGLIVEPTYICDICEDGRHYDCMNRSLRNGPYCECDTCDQITMDAQNDQLSANELYDYKLYNDELSYNDELLYDNEDVETLSEEDYLDRFELKTGG